MPRSPRLRKTLLAYTVNELGTWFGYVALAIGVYDHTRSAIATAGLFVARGLLPALLAPVLVTRAEGSPRKSQLAWLYALEGGLTVGMAVLLWRFSLPGVLVLVAVDGVLAVAATALVRASAAREALAGSPRGSAGGRDTAQRQVNASLNISFMFALAAGPAAGGLIVHEIGGPLALAIDAATFLMCAPLIRGQSIHVDGGEEDSVRARLLEAWRHIWQAPRLRILLLTEAVAIVFFSSVEPVEVIYVKATLHSTGLGFGFLVGAWGAGAALGAVLFARAVRRPLAPMLIGGTLLVGLAYLGFAAAPTIELACAAAIVGGVGNGIQWPSLISAVQQLTPGALHGRLMGAVGSMNALCPAVGFSLGGAIAAVSSPRVAMVVAGSVATCATFAFLRLPLRGLRSATEDQPPEEIEPVLAPVAR